ncbi:SIR2 family protein [Vibrio parahaemolyticus]|nr:SIR2 family protein [Vibrio parahaemolyticus]EHV9686576.1 SIR2 family protein [Vibrio parahaemolyticus]HAS6887674.1 SIR2 family protein [Vibrio parahaemolyticus]
MSEMFEIAYAAASNRICFFTGTGFSKAVTDKKAPSWQGLLEELIGLLPNAKETKAALFPEDGKNPLTLEESAQVIAIELSSIGLNIHTETAKLIESVELSGEIDPITEFMTKRSFRAVTTNYDKLLEKIANESDCHSIAPGLPIPRSISRAKIYHVHGSVDAPNNMVITSDDYFKFLNGESYFSRKLSTVLHENTVVILGYSLGDTNLKAIISDYKGFSKNHVVSSNIFLISRSSVAQQVKDYYSHCYGIRVLDNKDVIEFFAELNQQIPEAEKCVESSVSNIKKVLFENHSYKKEFLGLSNSFYEIIASLGAAGLSINDKNVVEAISKIIATKTELTHENNAWDQYVQLANWLIYIGSILDIKDTALETEYLKAVKRSMETMRRELYIGYSWHAYKAWNRGWATLTPSNRSLVRKFIEENSGYEDALSIVQKSLL